MKYLILEILSRYKQPCVILKPTLTAFKYYFELVNTTGALDGISQKVLLVNGTFPVPTIITDWGDTVSEYPPAPVTVDYSTDNITAVVTVYK